MNLKIKILGILIIAISISLIILSYSMYSKTKNMLDIIDVSSEFNKEFEKKIDGQNADIVAKFTAAYNDPYQKEKIEPWYKKAIRVSSYYKYLHDEILKCIEIQNGKEVINSLSLQNLKDSILACKMKLCTIIDTTKRVNKGFGNKHFKIINTVEKNYDIIITDKHLIENMVNSLRNLTSFLLHFLAISVEAHNYVINNVQMVNLTENNSARIGEYYCAKIAIAAIDTTFEPDVYINNEKLPYENGYAIYKVKCETEGNKFITGFCKFKYGWYSESKNLPINFTYYVLPPLNMDKLPLFHLEFLQNNKK